MTEMLDGKVALITGAGGGIGRASALRFAHDGARLVLTDRDGDALDASARAVREIHGEVSTIVADITVKDEVRRIVAQATDVYGRLDCAFNNAGVVGYLHPLVDYDDDDYDQVMAVNVRGLWLCLQEEIPAMLSSSGGAIVNASSGLGIVGCPQMPAYIASKHAVMGLTQAAALENAQQGIRVNAVLPGVVDTDMPARLTATAPEVMDIFRSSSPMGRLARPEEIAEAAAWLCSDRSSFVNGHGLAVDGGFLGQ